MKEEVSDTEADVVGVGDRQTVVPVPSVHISFSQKPDRQLLSSVHGAHNGRLHLFVVHLLLTQTRSIHFEDLHSSST